MQPDSMAHRPARGAAHRTVRSPGSVPAPRPLPGLAVLLVLATASLAALLRPAPLPAQDWEARAGYERQLIDSSLPRWSDWQLWHLEVRRSFDRGSLAAEILRSRRFATDDDAFAVDAYLDLAPRTYAHARLQLAPDARVIAEQDHRLELFYATESAWEISAGYRYMAFPDLDVHVVGAALGRYLPGWYLRLRTDLNPSFDRNALFVAGSARRYFDDLDGHLEASAGAGEEVVEVAAGPSVDIRDSRFASARAELFPWPTIGLATTLAYHWLDDLPSRLALSTSLLLRW